MGHLQFLRMEGLLQDDEAKVDALASLLAEVLTRNKLFNVEVLNPKKRLTVVEATKPTDSDAMSEGSSVDSPTRQNAQRKKV